MREAADNTASNDNAMPRLTTFASLTAFLALILTLAAAIFPSDTFAQGGPPPGGIIYYGNASVNGEPVPDGQAIIARVGDYESKPVIVSEGKYAALSVAAEASLTGQSISFFLGDVPADQTDTYQPHGIPVIKTGFDLTFSALPEPTPLPTPVSTDSPTPVSTQPLTPVQIPDPTPASAEPMVFVSGLVFIRGTSEAPTDSILVARIGDSYQSQPAAAIATDGTYGGLVVDPGDTSFEGGEIRFFLNGIPARTTAVYESGKLERTFDILFTDYPTPLPTHTPVPTNTPIPTPTNTPVPTPTHTPVPPTLTPAPTQTPIPTPVPTSTPIPPTSTPVPTPVPATPTQSEPTPTASAPTEESGGCFSVTQVSLLTGAVNALLMIAPLGLIFGLRSARRGERRLPKTGADI